MIIMKNNLTPSEDRIQKILDDYEGLTLILQEGIKAALLKHKLAGKPICEWRDGKVVWIPQEEI